MATSTQVSEKAGKPSRARSTKSRLLEPRGRPADGQLPLSGATEDDPLVSVQVVKVRTSVWRELGVAAGERKWHRSVFVRDLLDEWMRKRMVGKKRTGNGKAA